MRCFWTGFIAFGTNIPMTWVWRAINALFGAVIAGFRTMLFFYFLLTYRPKKSHYLCTIVFFYLYLCINVINTDMHYCYIYNI